MCREDSIELTVYDTSGYNDKMRIVVEAIESITQKRDSLAQKYFTEIVLISGEKYKVQESLDKVFQLCDEVD